MFYPFFIRPFFPSVILGGIKTIFFSYLVRVGSSFVFLLLLPFFSFLDLISGFLCTLHG